MKHFSIFLLLACVVGSVYSLSVVKTTIQKRNAKVQGKTYNFGFIEMELDGPLTAQVKADLSSQQGDMLKQVFGTDSFNVNDLTYAAQFMSQMGMGPVLIGSQCGDNPVDWPQNPFGGGPGGPGGDGPEGECPFVCDPELDETCPCGIEACQIDFMSEECATAITTYCYSDAGTDDPSCGDGADGEDGCPFSCDENVESCPCASSDCQNNQESTECASVISTYCSNAGASDPNCDGRRRLYEHVQKHVRRLKEDEDSGPPNFFIASQKEDTIATMFDTFANQEAIVSRLFGGDMHGGFDQWCEGLEPEETDNSNNNNSFNPLAKIPGDADLNKVSFIYFTSVYNPVTKKSTNRGNSVKDFLDGTCKIHVKANEAFTLSVPENLPASVDEERTLPCDYSKLKPVLDEMNNLLGTTGSVFKYLKNGGTFKQLIDFPFIFNKLEGKDAFVGCENFLLNSLEFGPKEFEVDNKVCYAEEGTEEWNKDPCCNWSLAETECCARRVQTITGEEMTGRNEEYFDVCGARFSNPLQAQEARKQALVAAYKHVHFDKAVRDEIAKEHAINTKILDGMNNVNKCWDKVIGQNHGGQAVAANKNLKEGDNKYWECETSDDCYGSCVPSPWGDKNSCRPLSQDSLEAFKLVVQCVVEQSGSSDIFKTVLTAYSNLAPGQLDIDVLSSKLRNAVVEPTCIGESMWEFNKDSWKYDHETGSSCRNGKLDSDGCLAEMKCTIPDWYFPNYWEVDVDEAACLEFKPNKPMTKEGYSCMDCSGENGDGLCFPETRNSRCRIHDMHSESACTSVGGVWVENEYSCYDVDATNATSCNKDCNDLNPITPTQFSTESLSPDGCHALSGTFSDGGFYYVHYEDNSWMGKKSRCVVGYLYNSTSNDHQNGEEIESVPQIFIDNGFVPMVSVWLEGKGYCDTIHMACLKKDEGGNFVDKSTCESSGGAWWSTAWFNGSGACQMHIYSRSDCESQNGLFVGGRYFEEGSLHTQELCDAGICRNRFGQEFTAEQCAVQNGECTKYCKSCVGKHWWDVENSVECLGDKSVWDETKCNSDSDCSWDSATGTAIFSLEVCGSKTDVGQFSCLADYSFDDDCVGEHSAYLQCKPEEHGMCKDEATCLANGECDDWEFESWDPSTGKHIYGACIIPFFFDEWGNQDCWRDENGERPSDGSSEAAYDWSRIGCRSRKVFDKSGCDAIQGTWKTRATTKAECESYNICRVPNEWGWHDEKPSMDQTECEKCGGTFASVYTWTSGDWIQPKIEPRYWKQVEFSTANEIKTVPNRWAFEKLIREVIEAVKSWNDIRLKINNLALLSERIETIACFCGDNGDTCESDPFVVSDTTFSDDITGDASNAVSNVAGGASQSEDTFDAGLATTEFTIVSAVSVTNTDTSDDGSRRFRALENSADTGKFSSPTCYSVVKNDQDVNVGQLIGSCNAYSVKDESGNAMTPKKAFKLCINIDPQIEVSSDFTKYAFALLGDDKKSITATDITVTRTDEGSLCADISDSKTYCAAKVYNDWKTSTTSADSSCSFIENIMLNTNSPTEDPKDPEDPEDPEDPVFPPGDTDSNDATGVAVNVFSALLIFAISCVYALN